MTGLSIFDFITKKQLEMILKFAPTPKWINIQPVYHYPVSPSSYHTCPGFESFLFGSYKADRGTVFHGHYGPIIIDALDVGVYQTEIKGRLHIACDKCKSGAFDFGGYMDVHIPAYEWQIDFKFSEQPASSMSDYDPAVSAYYWIANKGEIETVVDGKKKWIDSDLKQSNITIAQIHPLELEVNERIVDPLTYEGVIKQVKKKHDAVKHDLIYYEPGLKCNWCTFADKTNKICKKNRAPIGTFLN